MRKRAFTWLLQWANLSWGHLADRFSQRRVFCAGLALVCLTELLAPLAPSFGWLIVLRVLQALGTSTPYPAGMVMLRTSSPDGSKPPLLALSLPTGCATSFDS